MTPAEIIAAIQNDWDNESQLRYKIHQSNIVMNAARLIADDSNLSIESRISKMNKIAEDNGFTGIQAVLTFRLDYANLLTT